MSQPRAADEARPQPEPKAAPAVRAKASPLKVTVPDGTHTIEDPMLYWADHNVYPADNAVVLQGAAKGPIGDQQHATFWLAGVHAHDTDDGPSHLEAVMVYEVDCDDCPGDETTTAIINSLKATPSKPASLLGVDSMSVVDVDKDGQLEVVCEARFLPCCEGDPGRKPYTERIVLEVQGSAINRAGR
jgi:hypothetical protein